LEQQPAVPITYPSVVTLFTNDSTDVVSTGTAKPVIFAQTGSTVQRLASGAWVSALTATTIVSKSV
jgi:hypothetical protein